MEPVKNTIGNARKTSLQVSEIFSSLQGEGPWIGLPAVFIRLSGCIEPYCPWCDTRYALTQAGEMGIDDILLTLQPYPCLRAVITGGEPFLQWESGLSDLHAGLLQQGFALQYETSGKVKIPSVKDAVIVCSPKYLDGIWHFDPDNLSSADYYKFLAGDSGWQEAIEGFIETNRIDREKVFVMPLGATREGQLRNMEAVFGYCLRKGYRMSPRLHVLTFDARRGV